MTINSPSMRTLTEILPEDLPLLMGLGPVPIPKEVAAANKLVRRKHEEGRKWNCGNGSLHFSD